MIHQRSQLDKKLDELQSRVTLQELELESKIEHRVRETIEFTAITWFIAVWSVTPVILLTR